MALTQISTAGVKDDAVTAGKIPANAVGSSELADNAVDTAAIADDAVTNAKIANNAINTNELVNSAITTVKVADNAITTAKIADSQINNAKIGASAAIAGTKISPDFGSQAVTTTGNASVGETLTVTGNNPNLVFTDSNSNPDFKIYGSNGAFSILDSTNAVNRFVISSSGGVTIGGNTDFGAGIDVTGATTLTRSTDNATTSVITNNGTTGGNCLKLTSGGTGAGTSIFSVFRNNQSSEAGVFNIDGAGNVGIGENSPLASLHIKPASNMSQLLLEQNNATDGYALFQDGPNGGHLKFMRHINGSNTQTLLLRSDGGLCFGTDNGTHNALDDYEEGTFTPTLTNGTSLTNSGAYYVKIGRFVNFYCHISSLNIPNNSSQFRIANLPFTVLNGMYGGPCSVSYTGAANNSRIAALAPNTQSNDSYIYFHTTGIGEGFTLTNAHMQPINGGNLNVQGCYMTAT